MVPQPLSSKIRKDLDKPPLLPILDNIEVVAVNCLAGHQIEGIGARNIRLEDHPTKPHEVLSSQRLGQGEASIAFHVLENLLKVPSGAVFRDALDEQSLVVGVESVVGRAGDVEYIVEVDLAAVDGGVGVDLGGGFVRYEGGFELFADFEVQGFEFALGEILEEDFGLLFAVLPEGFFEVSGDYWVVLLDEPLVVL